MYSTAWSDIGHWDVPDMTEVLEEAYELVEEGIIPAADFQDFVFTNPAKMWAGMNPDFFKGTVVEKDVEKLHRLPVPRLEKPLLIHRFTQLSMRFSRNAASPYFLTGSA